MDAERSASEARRAEHVRAAPTNYDELWVCFKLPAKEPPADVLVLSFMSASDEAEAEARWGSQFLSGRVVAQQVREHARALYLDLVTRVGATPVKGRTLRQVLTGPGGYSRWWLLKASERDCISDHDQTYTTLIRLQCFRLVAEQYGTTRLRLHGDADGFASTLVDPVDLDGRPIVASGISILKALAIGFLSRCVHFVEYMKLWWLCQRLPSRPAGAFDVALESHWGWSVHTGPDGRIRDTYFTDLPEKLAERGVTVGWLTSCDAHGVIPRRERSLRSVVQAAREHPQVVLLERFLTLGDILRSVFNVRYLAAFLRFERSAAFRALFHVEGFDLYPAMRRPLIAALADSSVSRWELLATATQRACGQIQPKVLLTFLELFLYSRSLYAGARSGAPAIKIWTAQHAAYCRDKTFGFVEPARELGGEPDGCPMPAPDGIFVMGELARAIWDENGFAKDRVIVTGGLRYQHVGVTERPWANRAPSSLRILLVASMNAALDLDMCDAVTVATRDLPSAQIRLRNHPRHDFTGGREFARFRPHIEVTTGGVEEDLRGADLVLFAYSGLAEEALLRGIPTWQWLWSGFNTSVFLDLPVVPTFTSATELGRALQAFARDPERFRPARETQEVVLHQCFGENPAGASVMIADKLKELVAEAPKVGTFA